MAEHRITTPLSDEDIAKPRVGDKVFISGYILTGRDAAHKRLIDLIKEGKELPIDVKGQVIYYVGPTPARPGKPTGPPGPPPSHRVAPSPPPLPAPGPKGRSAKGDGRKR